ncbi:hypothetical protein Tco_0551213 [Tanacetum coccineum]
MEDAKEIAELQSMMEVIPDEEEVVVDAIPLATKPPSIIDWKIIKEGKIGYYRIIRANGNSKRYSLMIQMLKSFDREDLETLWKLVKAKHGYTRPEEGYERVLWGNLKIMFEHNIEDTLWRNLLGNKVLIWKLFDSCGVYFVRNNEVFGSILLVIMKPLMKKLDDFEDKYQIEGRIVRIKSLLEVTSIKLVLLEQKLLLLVLKVNVAGTMLQLLKDYNY